MFPFCSSDLSFDYSSLTVSRAIELSQISQRTRQISHNASFCNRNLHTCKRFWYRVVHCGIWGRCIVGFIRWIDCSHINNVNVHTSFHLCVNLVMLIYLIKMLDTFTSFLFRRWHKIGSWKTSSWKKMNRLSFVVNTMTSWAIVLTSDPGVFRFRHRRVWK